MSAATLEERKERAIYAVSRGNAQRATCDYANCSVRELKDWMNEDKDFRDAFRKARAAQPMVNTERMLEKAQSSDEKIAMTAIRNLDRRFLDTNWHDDNETGEAVRSFMEFVTGLMNKAKEENS